MSEKEAAIVAAAREWWAARDAVSKIPAPDRRPREFREAARRVRDAERVLRDAVIAANEMPEEGAGDVLR